jgi:hypothetical protein
MFPNAMDVSNPPNQFFVLEIISEIRFESINSYKTLVKHSG